MVYLEIASIHICNPPSLGPYRLCSLNGKAAFPTLSKLQSFIYCSFQNRILLLPKCTFALLDEWDGVPGFLVYNAFSNENGMCRRPNEKLPRNL